MERDGSEEKGTAVYSAVPQKQVNAPYVESSAVTITQVGNELLGGDS